MRGESGFSLIELMIALSIIGILATLAIPQYMGFRARASQSEIKANLHGLRAGEIVYFSETSKYTDDLSLLSWEPDGSPHYLYGFTSDASPGASGKNDTAELAAARTVSFATVNMVVYPGVPLTAANLDASCTVTGTGFTACAVANIDADATIDSWSLDAQANLSLLQDDSIR